MANQIKYQVGFDIQQSSLSQLKTSLQELQKMKISEIMKINDSDAASATSALNRIKQQAGRVQDALRQAFNAKLNTVNIETFNKSLKQSGTSIEQVYKAFKSAGTAGEVAFRNLSSQVLSTNIQLKETHGLLDKMATTLSNTIKWNMASAAVNGMTRSIEQAWEYVKSLDTSLNDIRIVTGKSAEEMGRFAVQANNAAKELGKTTTDYTNAALIYAQQGLSDKEVEERARITLKAANVTGQSTDEVSEQLTAVWNGYKVTAEQAELYVDRLAAVAAKSASDLEELSVGMSKVASAAAAMGVGEDQLAAQLSTIISVTRQAPESVGAALRTIYARISDIKAGISEDGVTLGRYSGKMAELGINVLDMNGNLRDMGEVMEEIGGKWGTLSREQQVYLAQTMAGQRQYNNLLALFDNFEQYNEMLGVAQNAAGTLQEQQDIYMESTAAHLKILKASVEDVYDSLVDTSSINGLIDILSNVASLTANFIDGLGGGGAVLQALGSIGVTVFSEQIAKGLNATITNLEIGRENAIQFDQALQAAKNWQGIPGLDETSKKLLANREQLLELARLMTPEQFSGMQSMLNELTEATNEVGRLGAQEEILDGMIKAVTKATDKWEGLNQVLKDTDAQETIIKRISQQEAAFTKTSAALDEYGTKLKALGGKIIEGGSVSQDLNEMRASLTSYMNQVQQLADSGQMERHREEVARLGERLRELPNDLPEDQLLAELELIAGSLKGMTANAGSAAAEVRAKLEAEFQGTVESITEQTQAAVQRTERITAQFETQIGRIARAKTIEDITKLAGGIASVGSAIQQIQNLGSIWEKQDLSTGQKLLQTITNLAISLPMLVAGFTKAATALGIMKIAIGQEAAAAAFATAANGAHVVSLAGVQIAANSAAVSVKVLNTVLSINPIVLFIEMVLAAVAAIGALENAQNKANKAEQQRLKKKIEAENQIQEEIKANESLYKSLEQLNKKYEDGEIGREELKTAVGELIEQYGLEGEAAETLAGSYDNLATYIKEARLQQARLAEESAKRQFEASRSAVTTTAKGSSSDVGYQSAIDSQYWVKLNPGQTNRDEPEAIQKALIDAGFVDYNHELVFSTQFNIPALLTLYDSLSAVAEQMLSEMTEEERENSEFYLGLKSWLDRMEPVVTQYRSAGQQWKAYQAQATALQSEFENKINFDDVKTLSEYITQRAGLVVQYRQMGLDQADAIKTANDYLAKFHGDLFGRYTDMANFALAAQDKFGATTKENFERIVNSLGELSPEQFLYLDLDDISGWGVLEDRIKYLASVDLSNLKGAAAESSVIAGESASGVTVEASSGITKATSQYGAYSGVASKVASGTVLSEKEFEELTPQMKSFFRRMTDGSYEMVGNAKEFYNIVEQMSLLGFFKDNQILKKQNTVIQNLQGTSYSDLTSKAQSGVSGVQKQLDYLTLFGYDPVQVGMWQNAFDKMKETKTKDPQVLLDITNAVMELGDQTYKYTEILAANQAGIYQNELAMARSAKTMEDLNRLYQGNVIGAQAFTEATIELDQKLDTEKLDPEELADYADYLQWAADQSSKLSDELEDNEDAAKIVAKGVLKMNDAVETLSQNWEDWRDILANSSKTSEEYFQTIGVARETIADLLDISKDYVSEDFITSHLEEVTAAADGNAKAIDNLKAALAQDVFLNIIIQNGFDEVTQQQMLSDFESFQNSIPDIQVGATLDDGDFLAKANDFITACSMTADQANAFFDTLGFEANFATETKLQEQRVPRYITQTKVISESTTEDGKPITTTATSTYQDGFDTFQGYVDVPAMSVNGKTPVINTLTRKAGGSFNNFSSKNSMPKAPSDNSNKNNDNKNRGSSGGNKSKGSGGGGKGSGGSGSSAEPDTSQKDRRQSLEDDRDIYHDINIEIEQINRNLDRTQKKQDRLYGKELLDNLNKQSRILDQHKQKLEEKHDLQEQDLKDQRQTLKNLGVTFDKYGNISNYMSILGDKQAQINNKTKEYNALIDAYNSSTDKDVKKSISDKADQLNKKIQEYEKDYQKLEEKIKNYDGLREEMEDVVDQIDEETQKQIEINIQKFRMNLEIRLQLGEAERDWNEFRREVLEHTDIIKDTDFQKIFSDALHSLRDTTSYFSLGGSKGSLQALTNQLMDTRAEIQSINKTGSSVIYGDNKAQAMEDLQQDLNELMSQMEDIQGLIDDIDSAYLDTIDDISDQFDKQIEDYEYIGDLIEHDIDLLQLLYGDRNYNAMDKYYTTLEKQNLKQLDMLKQQRDFWKQQWDAAVARGDTQAAKQFEENYKSTIRNLNQAIEDAASTIQNKYINAIENIFNELDKKISNGHGTDYLSTQWELMNKNADEYLDTINTAFAIQETERKYQDAVDEAKSIKNQQVLRDLMDEQLAILRNKEKVTQYDVDRAEKLLQVEQARMALQEAQSAKTSMRLKRDSQGNYSYEYVADGNAVDDAQGDLAQAQNDLYNFDKDRYQSNLDDMLSAWKDFQSEYKDILEDVSLTEQERIEKLALLREQYGEYINDKTTENLVVRNNLMESAFADLATLYNTDVENYNQMSIDQQNILMGDLVPAWESGIQQMADKVAGEGGFIPTCEDAFSDLTDATKKYKNELDDMAQTAGADLRDVTGGVDELAYSFENLIEDNGELTSRMYDEIDAITSLRAEAHSLVEEYKAVYNAAKLAVSGIHSFIQAQQAQTAAQTAAANGNGTAGSSGSRTGSGSGSGSGKNGSGSGTGSGSGKAGSPKGGNGSDPSAQTIEGIAGNIWVYGTWGNDPDRHNNMIAKFGKEQGDKIYNAVQAKFNSGYGYNGGLEHDWEYYKKYSLSSFRSGGYTGTWIGDAGKLAVLHQKEMVLNQEDTKNLLNSVYIMRSVMSTLNGNMNARLEDIKAGYSRAMSGSGDGVEQNVHIEASFPNVDSKREIEQAFNDLVSLAAQRAMRR